MNVGPVELGLIFAWLAVSIAVGYWSTTVSRRRGRSSGSSAIIGLFVALVVLFIGAVVITLVGIALGN